MENLSDEALMARVALAHSETDAMAILVARYRTRVYGMLARAVGPSPEADDLFQETWVRVAGRAHAFDPSRSFAPWLRTIATNLAIDWIRRQAKASLETVTPDIEHARSSRRSPEQEVAAAQLEREVARALAALPDAMKQAVLLRYFDEASEADMATTLGVPKGTVKSRLHHAIRTLRRILGEHPDAI